MRVIGGSAKGMRLAPVPPGTRPLSDRAREGLFSSLGDRVPGASVLDLFAGTGAMGIEALSRGAEHATLVERSSKAVEAIRQNLDKTGLAGQARVLQSDVGRFLSSPAEKVEVVMLDPPYATSESGVAGILEALGGGWLAPGWTVVLTRPRRSYTDVVPVNWLVTRRLEYGDTLVVVYREV
jgi:16S rRNA (guanine966-N2)-methyltransferase